MANGSGLCFGCGGAVPAGQDRCVFCGMPAVAVAPPAPGVPAFSAPGPSLSLGSASSQVRGRLPGRRTAVVAVAVIGLLLVAGGVVAGAARLVRDTPESVVGDYFDALADGDASAALDLVASAEGFDAAQYPLLDDAALAQDRWRPRDVKVGESAAAGQYGADARTIQVRYRAGDQTIAQNVVVVPQDDGFRLRLPFVLIGVDGQRGRAVQVNGVPLNVTGLTTAAFPGAYEAVAAGNTLLAESRATATAQLNGLASAAVALRFGVPALAAGAEETIRTRVRAAIDQCAATTQAQTAGCPFGLNVPGTGVTVAWAVTAYPTVSVRTDTVVWSGGSAVQLADDGAGRVHWTAGYTDFSGTKQSQSGDTPFRINGSAQAAPNGIQVSLT